MLLYLDMYSQDETEDSNKIYKKYYNLKYTLLDYLKFLCALWIIDFSFAYLLLNGNSNINSLNFTKHFYVSVNM